MRFHKSILIMAMLCILLACSDSFAGKRDKPRNLPGPSNIIDVKLNLVPFGTAGVVIGKASEQIDRYGGSAADKLLYGFGLSLNYYPKPRYAVGLNLARMYKPLPGEDVPAGRGWMYSGSFIFNLRTLVKYVTYTRFDVGVVTGSLPRSGDDAEYGSHLYLRLGLGVFTFTAGTINTRVEAYYTHAFSSDHFIVGSASTEIGYNAQCFGVEFGVGIPLSKR